MKGKFVKFVHPPHLKFAFIREKADEFRQCYVKPPDLLPVPIVEIVELQLGIHPIPIIGLKERIDLDGFLTKDLNHICIDYNVYMDEKQENRLRFTYAHEVGHYVLHKNEIQECDFRTPEDWIHFHEDFLEDDLNWFEQHAYEFAGRLLVPRDSLINEMRDLYLRIQKFRKMAGDDEENLIQAASRIICKKFQVSPEVISRRIRIEKVWQD
ncbi:MAG: ImmA/IrrE family metallo-endopeptidase [Candidatus Aminicenantales bacterium]